jgi:hypothetical protein
MLIPSEGLTQLLDKVSPFHSEIVILSRKLRMKVGRMIKRKRGLRRKQGLPR